MLVISVDKLFACETCFYKGPAGCKLWCDNGERYRPAYDKLGAFEAEPLRHGRWVDMGVENETGNIYFCSACFERYNSNKKNVEMGRAKEKPNYCPNCGAKMDKEDV